jgi:hypothetical protein
MLRRLKARAAAVKAISALLTQAEETARRRGAQRPAAEHLVLAALQLPDGTAARALERIGSSAAEFGAALDAQETEDLERIGVHADDDRIGSELPQRANRAASTGASPPLRSCSRLQATTHGEQELQPFGGDWYVFEEAPNVAGDDV